MTPFRFPNFHAIALLLGGMMLGGLPALPPAAAQETTLVVEGTGDSQDLLRAIAEEFNAAHAGKLRVEVPDSIGSSGGVRALVMERTSLARIARPLKDSEKAEGLDELQFAFSPIVFAVHPAAQTVSNLDGADIVAIYGGEITNWKDLGGPDEAIVAVDREPGDSSRSVLEKTIPGFGDIDPRQAKVFFTTPETVEGLRTTPHALGYTPLAAVRDTELRMLDLEGVSPEDAEAVRAGQYPHVVKLGLAFRPPLAGAAREFVEFVTGETGQRIMKEFGAVPVRPSL